METFPKRPLINTGDSGHPVSVAQAMLDGYAPDNELYQFSDYPSLDTVEIAAMRGQDYATIFGAVSSKLLGDAVPEPVQQQIAREVYRADNFDFDRDDGNLRLTGLPTGVQIVGLSDGPTGAFKDMAMQPFARWVDYLQTRAGTDLTILLSTSGDTGPAALKAFGGLQNTEIVNMLPKSGVSRFQWSQMAELAGASGIHVLEVDGNFSYINDLHMEADLQYDLGSVNSVNIARIIAQVPYYFAAYTKVIERTGGQIGDPVDVSVPSGNFGNALSAMIARRMGLPLRDIIVATNENNTLETLINHERFELAAFQQTDSSAQDVRMPSNVWRYLAMLFDNNPARNRQIYRRLRETGSVALRDVTEPDETVRRGILATAVSSIERAETIQKTYQQTGQKVIIDPHTANGIAAVDKCGGARPDAPMLAMETAKPFKFNESIGRILGITPPRPDRFKGLEQRVGNVELEHIDNLAELLAYLGSHTTARLKV